MVLDERSAWSLCRQEMGIMMVFDGWVSYLVMECSVAGITADGCDDGMG